MGKGVESCHPQCRSTPQHAAEGCPNQRGPRVPATNPDLWACVVIPTPTLHLTQEVDTLQEQAPAQNVGLHGLQVRPGNKHPNPVLQQWRRRARA